MKNQFKGLRRSLPRRLALLRSGQAGFSLIELMVVMVILGILGTFGAVNYQNSQKKSRDSQRKNDLNQFQKALEMYYSDKGKYPAGLPGSGGVWQDIEIEGGAIYMKVVPNDPLCQGSEAEITCYLYETVVPENEWYRIYAKLENTGDPIIEKLGCESGCGPGGAYNYYVESENAP